MHWQDRILNKLVSKKFCNFPVWFSPLPPKIRVWPLQSFMRSSTIFSSSCDDSNSLRWWTISDLTPLIIPQIHMRKSIARLYFGQLAPLHRLNMALWSESTWHQRIAAAVTDAFCDDIGAPSAAQEQSTAGAATETRPKRQQRMRRPRLVTEWPCGLRSGPEHKSIIAAAVAIATAAAFSPTTLQRRPHDAYNYPPIDSNWRK